MTDITIIIPTYNRPDYLRRILDYYGDSGNDFDIIVADSSSKENKDTNRETIKSFSNLTISYLTDYSEDINPWHKFEDALKSVFTKYAVFCGDDDFLVPDGVKKAKDFLEENPDFTVAHGDYIGFFAKNNQTSLFNRLRRQNNFSWKIVNEFKSIDFPDAQSRLTEHLSNYSISTFYGVHRTDFLKMIFEETRKFTNDNRFGELLPSALTLTYGKMKKIDVLYAAHEINPQSTGLITDTLYDFKTAGTFDEKYEKFKECLSEHLVKNSELETDKAKMVIDRAMSVYFEKNYPENFKTFLKDKIKEIFVYLPLVRSAYIAFNFANMKNVPADFKKNPDLQRIKNCAEKHKAKKI